MIFRAIFLSLLIIIVHGCSTWTHNSGNNKNLENDKNFCSSYAYMVAPTYICRNITYCQPDETNIALQALAQNSAAFRQCMFNKGYREMN